jgi:uncharacterized protein
MRFRLRDLPVERALALPLAFVGEALAAVPGQAELGADGTAPGDLTLVVQVTEEQGSVFARGELSGWVHVACSRCLGPARLRLAEPFATTFLPHAEHVEAETELELNEADLDVAVYRGEEIDLTPVVRDQLVLAVPLAPLCAEDCRGLCPRCGADLNQSACSCPPAAPDPRFAALERITFSPDVQGPPEKKRK